VSAAAAAVKVKIPKQHLGFPKQVPLS